MHIFLGDEWKFGLAPASEALFNHAFCLAQAVGWIGAGFGSKGNSEIFKNFPQTEIQFITKETFMGEYTSHFVAGHASVSHSRG